MRNILPSLALFASTALLAGQRAPFSQLRWQDGKPEVHHADAWWRLAAIDGVAVDDILTYCDKTYGAGLVRKRFGEDLVTVLTGIGHPPGDRVDLELVDPVSGAVRVFESVPMTAANRQAIRAAADGARRTPFDTRADFPKTLPFAGMRATGDGVEVQLDGDATWYEWVRIDNAEATTIRAWCERSFGDRWWKRITEDLPQVLARMGHPVGDRVDLVLRDPTTGKTMPRPAIAMTAANRARVRGSTEARDQPNDAMLTPAQWRADLDQLAVLVGERFSYADRLRIDVDARVAELRTEVGDQPLAPAAFADAVRRWLAPFGDGHVRVDGDRSPRGYLPLLLQNVGDRVVALRPDRSGFADADHPYLVAIDGRPVADWRAIAARRIAHGSAQLVDRRSLRMLRDLQFLRSAADTPPSPVVTLELAADDDTRRHVELRLSSERPIYGPWPRPNGHRTLVDGTVGYLRIAEMTDDPLFLDGIDSAMRSFNATTGLVIDVRGNGGGSRDVLRRLFPYFLGADDPPHVANIAAYRLQRDDQDPRNPDGYLDDRALYPATWPGWSNTARDAIAAALRTFRPQWKLPTGKFSAWHFFVLDRSDNPNAYHYDKPVVVLLDDVCFSATDIFLGAFAGRPGVTLLGTPSGGGSGRGQSYRLRHSGLTVRLSTMASFRPDGRLYDGEGIAPDVVAEPIATDFLGSTDSVLEAAVRLLR